MVVSRSDATILTSLTGSSRVTAMGSGVANVGMTDLLHGTGLIPLQG
jgi:hypothetical protein